MKIFLRIFFAVAAACWLGFIFSNSLKDSSESTTQSGAVTQIVIDTVKKIDPNANPDPERVSVTVRKTAHFSEFFLLSALVALSFVIGAKRSSRAPFLTLPICLAACVTDEILQIFSPGRACQIIDMGIDFAGALLSFFIVWSVFRLSRKKERKKL